MLAGAKGVISVTANVTPRLMHDLCRLATSGDAQGARAINEQLADLHAALFLESNPIPVKWALSEMGLIPPGIRLPLTPLAGKHHDAVRQVLRRAGIL